MVPLTAYSNVAPDTTAASAKKWYNICMSKLEVVTSIPLAEYAAPLTVLGGLEMRVPLTALHCIPLHIEDEPLELYSSAVHVLG